MRLESLLQRQNTRIVSVAGALQNDGQNAPKPFGSGEASVSGIRRFPTDFTMRVEWTTRPTVSVTANATLDDAAMTAFCDAVEAGIVVDGSNDDGVKNLRYMYDGYSSQPIIHVSCQHVKNITITGSSRLFYMYYRFACRDDGTFLADANYALNLADLFAGTADPETFAPAVTRIDGSLPFYSASGAEYGAHMLSLRRTLASEDEFVSGPKFGETGQWEFDMECLATGRTTAGTGKLFFEW